MNDMFIKGAKVCRNGVLRFENIIIKQGKFAEIGAELSNDNALPELSADGCFAVSGFFDIHTHGSIGVDVNAADEEGLNKISRFFASQGTTRWLASVLTDTPQQTLHCIDTIRRAMKNGTDGAQLMGIHLEGPFLSPEYKGAMPKHLLKSGDSALLERYLDAADGAVLYITIAPEIQNADAMLNILNRSGVRAAVGHSGASYEQTMHFIENGACAVTHTFNGMALFHQHRPGLMGAALESDIKCEAICDGRHLHPGTVRMLLKCKGADKVMAVTDSIMAAGLPDGSYKLGVNDIVVQDGDAMLADGSSRAGSTLTMVQALKNIMGFTGLNLESVMPVMGENQAKMLGLDDSLGEIKIGSCADLVLLNEHLDVIYTLVNGKAFYPSEQV